MKKIWSWSIASIALITNYEGYAASTASQAQNVTYSVPAVSVLSVSGNVTFGPFTTPTAGSDFTAVTDSTTTYNVTNNAGSASRKVTGQLAAALPTGLSLTANLAAPPSATSTGVTSLSGTSAITLVSSIGNGAFPNLGITYSLAAAVATAAVTTTATTFSLTYTLTAS